MELDRPRQIRLSKQLADRIERYRAKMSAKVPGVQVTFSDAMRALMERGLAAENGR